MCLGGVHLDRVDQRTAGLLFKVLGTSIPELGDVEHRVVDSRCIATTMLPAMTQRGLLQVDPTHTDHVA